MVPMDLLVWEPAARVSRDQLRADDRLRALEVLRQPQGSNPSYLTKDQFAAVLAHCIGTA
jgi:hypothetical protein